MDLGRGSHLPTNLSQRAPAVGVVCAGFMSVEFETSSNRDVLLASSRRATPTRNTYISLLLLPLASPSPPAQSPPHTTTHPEPTTSSLIPKQSFCRRDCRCCYWKRSWRSFDSCSHLPISFATEAEATHKSIASHHKMDALPKRFTKVPTIRYIHYLSVGFH